MARYLTSAALALALVAGGGYWLSTQSGGSAPGVDLSPVSAATAQEVDTSGIVEMTLGSTEAPVTVIEYASFTCPHCATFHANVFKDLKETYIDTGKIQFIYREVYFDRFGLWAGMVARCGGPERYFGITEVLYEQQNEWTANGSPAVVADNLRRIGRVAGMSDEQVDACLQDGEKAQALVAWYQKNAEADGITSTPSFVINGENYSNMNFADFSNVLNELLAE
jgi:protein-disulfide isomerase